MVGVQAATFMEPVMRERLKKAEPTPAPAPAAEAPAPAVEASMYGRYSIFMLGVVPTAFHPT